MNEQQHAFKASTWPRPANDKVSPLQKGDPVVSFRGDDYVYEGIASYAGGGSSGRVCVTRQCAEYDPEAGECSHHWHREGIERNYFFPFVVGLYLGTEDGTPAS